jgi:hypothetical protein
VLFSPSRGLFIFSPFLAFAVWGAVESWRHPSFEYLRAISVAASGMLLLTFKWFEWFGGWVFGYRLIVELTPLLMILLIPVAGRILASRGLRAAFLVLGMISIAIQALGAFAYDPTAWNGRKGFEIRMNGEPGTRILLDEEEANRMIDSGNAAPVGLVTMDVAQPKFRGRFWSFEDGQLAWLLKPGSSGAARAARRRLIAGAAREKMDVQSP